ncbi:MAG: endonuclease/exonuclease/phosphatase family protein [Caldilineaceae bacterium SB0664_bin_22]|nr:endonuclease/exonuclease/phosphatase family protein [Caldilineaceae bacterium SB0664_bin_22]
MIRLVSWNIAKRRKPWRVLVEMARRGEFDVALLQEAGNPPGDLVDTLEFDNDVFWDRHLYDRWPLVVRLSDRVAVEGFHQVPPISELGERDIGVSGIGTMATARVIPVGRPEEAFVVASMYARWMKPHPTTCSPWKVGASDVSAHRILLDLSALVGHRDPSRHRILAAGDLNMFYGATGRSLSLPERERTVWDRFKSLGLEFLGPQVPNGRQASTPPPDVPPDTRNVPTYYHFGQSASDAVGQLDYTFASRGFHEKIRVRALNGIDEWGPSDHCRLLIKVAVE